jgi:transposase-like protein
MMSKSKGAYPPEFRRQMVELVRAGRTPEELAREFEPTSPKVFSKQMRLAGAAPPNLPVTQRRGEFPGVTICG